MAASVMWLFHEMPLVGMQCVIVVISGHTHLLSFNIFCEMSNMLIQ